MAWTRRLALGLALLLASQAALVNAQRRSRRLPPCTEGSTESRDQYICGLHAVERLQYLDAVRLFAAAYAGGHEPAALFNQGLALKSMGRFVEARQIFARLLEAHPDASIEVRNQAQTHLRQAEESMARVRIQVEDAEGASLMSNAFSVELNGRRAAPNSEGLFELDPGEAVFVVSAEGYESARWEGSLHRGQRTLPFELVAHVRESTVVVEPIDQEVVTTPTEEPETGSDNTLTWVLITGAVAVLAAGAVVTYVLVSDREQQLQLRPAPEFRSTDVLRF